MTLHIHKWTTMAMRRAGVHSELHVFPHGGHGYGLRPSVDPVSKWPKLVEAWLKRTEWFGVLHLHWFMKSFALGSNVSE